jgi:hypothetical protein
MKARRLAGSLLIASLLLAAPARASMTDLERQRLLAHLTMTAAWLKDELAGVSLAQARFQPAPQAWSILQVLEHLVLVAPIYWNDLQAAVKAGPTSRVSGMSDADVLWYGIDRARRENAIPTEDVKGTLADLATGVTAYERHHQRLVQYVATTKDDLRRFFVPRQGSDAYQWALLISTHEQRHILQIREIKAHAAFPRR